MEISTLHFHAKYFLPSVIIQLCQGCCGGQPCFPLHLDLFVMNFHFSTSFSAFELKTFLSMNIVMISLIWYMIKYHKCYNGPALHHPNSVPGFDSQANFTNKVTQI